MIKTVSIMGVKYKVYTDVPVTKDKALTGRFGYCAFIDHRIVIADLNTIEGWAEESDECRRIQVNTTLRHEVIHAFLAESGLRGSCTSGEPWSLNEEMIDWFALQMPKIVKVFKELGCEGE